MTPERWQQIDHLFHSALERAPQERAHFIIEACAGDEALKWEVGSLLKSHEQAESFIEEPASDVAADLLAGSRMKLVIGQQIDHYTIVDLLGIGGMGEVYLAQDLKLGRKVALKLLPSYFTSDVERVRRFEREARAASALNHPNILTIFEIGQSDRAHFIAAEFVDGKTLRQLINEKQFTLGEALNVVIQVADALSEAHTAGIVHRDIKPENIMVRADGYVKVLDFGLAKLVEQVSDTEKEIPTLLQSSPGLVMGTVQYMSPEQARGGNVNARTDIWSLGVVLYELLAGRVPFSGETPSHVMVALMENVLPPLKDAAVVPAELERIVDKALTKSQKERYQNASKLTDDLKRLKDELHLEARMGGVLAVTSKPATGARATSLAKGSPTGAVATQSHPTSSAEYLVGEIRRHPRVVLFATAALLTAVLVVADFYFARGRIAGGEPIDSVAVLSFINETGDADAEYLSDGISNSVISSLSQLPNLRVISQNAVSRYKGKQVDAQAIGRELNVRAVLIGRMVRRDGALTISAELVDASDNRRLWGDQFHSQPSDILVLEKEIAAEIAEKLRLKLAEPEKQRLAKRETESAEAHDAYLRGRSMLGKHTATSTAGGIEYLEQATKLDPNYALAYATLSFAYWSLPPLNGQATKAELMHKAKLAAMKALELDEALAEAHTALGLVLIFEEDLTGAEAAFKRGLVLNPSSGFVHTNYAQYLKIMGRVDEAIAESQQAVKLEPDSVLYNRNLEMNLYFARRYDEAIAQSLKTLELDPNMPNAHRFLAKAYEQKKLYSQAVEAYLKTEEFGSEVETEFRQVYANSGWKGFWRKALELKLERQRTRNINVFLLAENYARLGELDQAFASLEKIAAQVKAYYGADPFWDDFQSDPRYQDFVHRLGVKP